MTRILEWREKPIQDKGYSLKLQLNPKELECRNSGMEGKADTGQRLQS